MESIYPTELSKSSERDIELEVEPEVDSESEDKLTVSLSLHFPDGYPDVLPDLSLKTLEGHLTDVEVHSLLADLSAIGTDNLGMAMTFTLVSHLRESLSSLVITRAEKREKEERERERIALEEERARTRGTPVTVKTFKAWKAKFDLELAARKTLVDEEKLKALTPKERDEWKKAAVRLSGRQLFERNKALEEDMLLEEGTVSVDASQYERPKTGENEEDDDGITFSDSD